MTNQEIISTGQTIKTETHIGGNTAARVGGVIQGIGENLGAADNKIGAKLTGTGELKFDISSFEIGTKFLVLLSAPSDISFVNVYADSTFISRLYNTGFSYVEYTKVGGEQKLRTYVSSSSQYSAFFVVDSPIIRLFDKATDIEEDFNLLKGLKSTATSSKTIELGNIEDGTKLMVQVDGGVTNVYVNKNDNTRVLIGQISDNTFNKTLLYTKTSADVSFYIYFASGEREITILSYEYLQSLYSLLNEEGVLLSFLENKKITPNDFKGLDTPINLFNEDEAVGGYLANQTTITPNSNYITSDYIEVRPNTSYVCQGQRFLAQYDENKNYIGSVVDINSTPNFTTGEDTYYVRITFKTGASVRGLYTGSNVPKFTVPFNRVIGSIEIDTTSFKGVEPSVNLLNIHDTITGYLSGGGNINSSGSAYFTSQQIKVKGGDVMYFKHIRFLEQYDSDGVNLAYTDLNNTAQSVTLNANTSWIRVSFVKTNAYKSMVYVGNTSIQYVPYKIAIPFIKQTTKFSGKKMVCFGDSITGSVEERDKANWCMFVSDALDIETINQGYWSGRIAAVGGDEVKNTFSLPRLVDSIISGDWSLQDIVYNTQGYEQHAQQLDKLKNIDFSTVDFVSISLGTNDLASNTPFEIENDPLNPNSVNGAFRYSISRMLQAYPQLKFIITTPIYRFSGSPSTGEDYMNHGRGIQDFVDDYIELGKEIRVPVINLFNNISVNKYNKDYYWGTNGGDGLHPNNNMKELMGNTIAGWLNTYF